MTSNSEVKKLIKKLDRLYRKSSYGAWCVWDGPRYASPGRDLCIGTNTNWLANMDEAQCVNYGKHLNTLSEWDASGPEKDCERKEWTDICTLGDESFTKEQRATADLIVELHNNWPEIRELLKSLL